MPLLLTGTAVYCTPFGVRRLSTDVQCPQHTLTLYVSWFGVFFEHMTEIFWLKIPFLYGAQRFIIIHSLSRLSPFHVLIEDRFKCYSPISPDHINCFFAWSFRTKPLNVFVFPFLPCVQSDTEVAQTILKAKRSVYIVRQFVYVLIVNISSGLTKFRNDHSRWRKFCYLRFM